MAQKADDGYAAVRDSLNEVLNKSNDWSKRKSAYLNQFDLYFGENSKAKLCLSMLYSEACKNGDVDCQLNTLQYIIGSSANLDSIRFYANKVEKLIPSKPSAKEVLLFANMRCDILSFKHISPELKLKKITEQFQKYKDMGDKAGLYDKIRVLGIVCSCLKSSIPESDLFVSSVENLKELVDKLPERNNPVWAQAYLLLAITYSDMEMHKQSIAIDKHMLRYISNLEMQYQREGRKYRTLANNYYTVYRRMLCNYEGLSVEERDYYYSKVLELCKKYSYINSAFMAHNGYERVHLYYYLSKGKYDEAGKCVDSLLKSGYNDIPRSKLLQYGIKIYSKTGSNKDHLIELYAEYLNKLKERDEQRLMEKLHESQILYDIGDIKSENMQLVLQKKDLEIVGKRRMIILSGIIIVCLLLFSITVIYLYIDKKRYSIVLQRDKSKLESAQKRLIEAKNRAEKMEKMEAAFLANVSHEIRTPLNAIVGFSRLLLECQDKDDKVEYERIVSENTVYLLRLVDDVLELSRLESGNIQINKELFDMSEYLNTFATIMSKRVKGDKVEIKISTPKPEFLVEADRGRVNQIFTNFTTNAIKYTSEGSINIGFSVEEGGIKLFVKDTGAGIAPEHQERVFKRFDKLDSFVSGAGLGLSITKALVEAMNGKIGFQSGLGKGSLFWVWLPIKEQHL